MDDAEFERSVKLATYEAKALPKRKPHKEERIRRLTSRLFSLEGPLYSQTPPWLAVKFFLNEQLQVRHSHKINLCLRHATAPPSQKNCVSVEFGIKEDVDVFSVGELSGSLKNVFAFIQHKFSLPLEHKVEVVTLSHDSKVNTSRVMRITLMFGEFENSTALHTLLAHFRSVTTELHWSDRCESSGLAVAAEVSPVLVQVVGSSDVIPMMLRPLVRRLQSECSVKFSMDNLHEADSSSVEYAWNSMRMFVKSYLKDILTVEETHAVIKNIYFNTLEVIATVRAFHIRSSHGAECDIELHGVPTLELLPTREELSAATTSSSTKRPHDSLMLSDVVPEENLTLKSLVRRILILTNLRKPPPGYGLKHIYVNTEADSTPIVLKAMARMHDDWLRVPFDSFLRSKYTVMEPVKDRPQEQQLEMDVTEYAPMMFNTLRNYYGIPVKFYAEALQHLERRVSEGKSRCDFFLTRNDQFYVKVLQKHEFGALKESLAEYFRYMMKSPNTLLTKYCGLYKIVKVDGKRLRLLVMHTIFHTTNILHEKYDLKGAIEGRNTGKTVSSWKPSTGSDMRAPVPTLCDLDARVRLHLGHQRQSFLDQLDTDTKFLESLNVMDYSLLVGVHNATKADSLDSRSPYLPHFGRISQFAQLSDSRITGRLYYMGIIDFLQVWNMRKQAEGTFKSFLYAKEISSVPPKKYRERFMQFVSTQLIER